MTKSINELITYISQIIGLATVLKDALMHLIPD